MATHCSISQQGYAEVWSGDYGPTSGPFAINQYPIQICQSQASNFAIVKAGSPIGWGQHLEITVYDTDLMGDPNPRGQMQPPYHSFEGTTHRVRGSFMMLEDPPVGSGQFFLMNEFYGPPNQGSPPVQLVVPSNTSNIALENYFLGSPYLIWSTPIVLNRWFYFEYTLGVSSNPSLGYIANLAVAYDGTANLVPQQVTWQSVNYTKFFMQTLDSGSGINGIKSAIFPDLYRSRGLEPVSTVKHGPYKVSSTAPV